MTREELVARIKAYEWVDFECKKARADIPKDAYSTVSAFSNTQGGWLLFGISENAGRLEITGVDPRAFDRMQGAFLSTLRGGQKFNHIVHADAHVYELEGKRILAFHIHELNRRQKPLYLNGNPWQAYIRRGARDEKVTDHELQRFLRDSAPRPWDSDTRPDIDPATHLDPATVRRYQDQFYRRHPDRQPINDPLKFLEEWNFLALSAGRTMLTNAAVLLFGTDRAVRALLPRPVVDYQRIDTRFERWSVAERWHDRMIFEENLFKTWSGLVARYSRIAERPFSVDTATLRRNDDPPDYIAFREATINLLIHQDYGDPNCKAAIKWFTDRLVFWNPGNAFANPAELLEAGEQDIRNPLIVSAFRRIGLSEQAGTGIRAIARNWRELGRAAPRIQNDKGGKSFELVLQQEALMTPVTRQFQQQTGVHLAPAQAAILAQAVSEPPVQLAEAAMIAGINLAQAAEALDFLQRRQWLQPVAAGGFRPTDSMRALLQKQDAALDPGQADPVSGTRSGPGRDQAGTKSGPSQEQLETLHNCLKEIAISELMALTGRTSRTKFRNRVLKPMLAAGWVAMTIPEKPSSSKQRYRITESGRQILAQGRQWFEENRQ